MEGTLIFKVKGNDYPITFPNVGEFRRIESLKQALSNGTYSQLAATSTDQAQHAADIVDVEAMFTVLCPDILGKGLASKDFSKLGLVDFKELHSAYLDQIIPWWNENLKEIGLMK
jgi:hypothetical protein